MAQGKLSQQIMQQEGSNQRITRTQKKRVQVERIKEVRKFESLKAQAKQIQEEKFKDKVVDEKYVETIPKSFDVNDYTRNKWYSKPDYVRRRWLNNAARNKYRGAWAINTHDRTRKKTIPFTLEDHGEGDNSYKDVYESLSPDLKQFFDTPEEVLDKKATRINTTKATAQEKLSYADQKLAEAKKKYQEKENKYREWWGRKSSKYRSDQKNRDRKRKKLNDIEDNLEEEEAKWRGYKKGLNESLRRLNKGDDLSFSDIENYAYDVADYQERREEARNDNRKAKREQQRKIDSLIERGYSPMLIQEYKNGKPTKSKITFYNSKTKDYSKLDLQLKTTNVSKFERSKIKTANISQSFELDGKKFTFKTRSPVFKTKTGQLTTVFGGLGKTETQVIQDQRKQINIQEKEFDRRASQYLETTGFKSDVKKKVETKNLTFWQKIKAAYVMTPFGTNVELPKKYNVLRSTRTNTIGSGFISIKGGIIPKVSLDITKMNTLTWDQSVSAIKDQELKKSKREKQIELIDKFNKITEAAPEDIQFYVQGQGLSQLARAGIRSDTFSTEGEISFSSPEFTPSKSFDVYQMQKALDQNNKWALGFTLGRIASTEGLKMYGIGKAVGWGIKGVSYVGKGVYSGLGGGLKIADMTVKGGKATATVTVATGKGSNILKTVGMGALGLGIGGLYTYSKVKQKKYMTETFGRAGELTFYAQTGGELLGFGALAGESAMKRSSMKKLQAQIKKETYFKEARAEGIKNINKYGKYSKSAKLSYRQVGQGQDVLSKKAINNLAKEYSKIASISNKEAAKIISEKGIYQQVFKVKSNVPSYERALKYIKTGKAPKTVTNYYETGRYGIFSAEKSAKGSSEFAFDFKLNGKNPTNIVLKLTQSKGKYAITNVFEKARFSPKDPMKQLRLKEIFVTKASNVKVAKFKNIKLTQFDIENRLLQLKPYGSQRLTMKEALNIGKMKPSENLLKEYWAKSGSIGKSSTFKNLKLQAAVNPKFKDGVLYLNQNNKYNFAQVGSGKAGLPMKNPRFDLLDDALKQIRKQQLRSAIKQSRAAKGMKGLDLVDDILKKPKQNIKSPNLKIDMGSSSGSNVVQMIEKKMQSVSTDQIMKNIQVSPTIQSSPNLKTAMRLETLPAFKDTLAFKVATGQATQLKSKTKLKQMLKTRQKSQQDLSLKQALQLDLGLKQTYSTKQKTSQIQTPAFNVGKIVENLLRTPTATRTPIQPSSRIPKISLPVANLKKLLKMKKQKSKEVETFFYSPDFVSRAIGLDPIEVTSVGQAQKILRKINTGLNVRRGVRVKIPN